MFPFLGSAVSRAWPLFLACWVLILGWTWLLAPAWDDVAESGMFSFLPKDAPSNRGLDLLRRAFPEQIPASNIVLVLSRADSAGLGDEDRTFVASVLKPALEALGKEGGGNEVTDEGREPVISRIRSLLDKGEGELLKSSDHNATLVVVELAGEFLSRRQWPTIAKVEDLLARLHHEEKLPRGLEISVTGNAVVGRDVLQAERRSADAIGRWTIIVVIFLLLAIYHAPLVALIPLATVFVAVELSLKLLSLLAYHRYLEVSDTMRIYVTVLGYGAGVDYCLFLIARYREELEGGADARAAAANAVGRVGKALAASAGTVICGIGTLAFARFGKYHQAGICIPLTLGVVLASALTFAPALLRITGRWAFWPSRLAAEANADRSRRSAATKIWEKIAQALLARPGTIWLLSMAALAPFVVVGVLRYQQVDYGISDALPKAAPSTAGTAVLKEHFSPGMTGPVTVLLTHDDVYFGTIDSHRLIKTMSDNLERQEDTLQLADIRSLAYPFGISRYGKEILTSITVSTPPASGEAIRHSSFRRYVSTAQEFAGHVAWIDLVSKLDPLSHESIGNLRGLESAFRDALPAELEQSQLDFVGPTANLRDLEEVTRGDFQRIQLLVPAAVFVILLVIARNLIVSLYLIGSVVVSFLATLGVTFLVFWALDPADFIGLDWKVPVFLFTILMAVGEDYNILLLTRVREEQVEHGAVRGVTAALVKTGGVISSCGFIMAGTFAALLTGSLIEMKQLGFALAFGILLDTLVVRSLLVPAFLIWRRSEE